MDDSTAADPGEGVFRRRAIFAISITLFFLLLVVIVVEAASVLAVIFLGVLFAVLLDGLTRVVVRSTPLPRWLALSIVCLLLLALVAGAGLLVGPRISGQLDELGQQITEAWAELRDKLSESRLLRPLVQDVPTPRRLAESFVDQRSMLPGAFNAITGTFTNVLVILFVGLYGSATPALYIGGAIRIVPPDRRERAREVVTELGRVLRLWLGGRFISMGIVAVLTTAGLFAIGMPLALTLGLIAGLLSFVPYLGPIASAIPAVLLAGVEGSVTAAQVIVLYFLVQLVESYLVTPLVQRRMVSMPPALLISAQIFIGYFLGILGIIVATPVLVVVLSLVQLLYVEDRLNEHVRHLGE